MSDEVIAAGAKALGRFGIECDEDTPIEPLRVGVAKAKLGICQDRPSRLSMANRGVQGQEGEDQTTMSEEKIVRVRLEDLCEIGDSMSTMMHDSGQW